MACTTASRLITLPNLALSAIASNLSRREQLVLGRQVLQQGKLYAANDQAVSTAAEDAACCLKGHAAAKEAAFNKTSHGEAAGSAVLSLIHDCTIKLPKHTPSLASLHHLPHLKQLCLYIESPLSCLTDPQTRTSLTINSNNLGRLTALSSLKLSGSRRCQLAFGSDIAAAAGCLTDLQQLEITDAYLAGEDSNSISTPSTISSSSRTNKAVGSVSATNKPAVLAHLSTLTALTSLHAPKTLNKLAPEDAAAEIAALWPILPQLQAVKLPRNSLGPEAAAMLLQGLLAGTAQEADHTSSSSDSSRRRSANGSNGSSRKLQILDLSGNRMFTSEDAGDSDIGTLDACPDHPTNDVNCSTGTEVASLQESTLYCDTIDSNNLVCDAHLASPSAQAAVALAPALKIAASCGSPAMSDVHQLLAKLAPNLQELRLADTGMGPEHLNYIIAQGLGLCGSSSSSSADTAGSNGSMGSSSKGRQQLLVLDVSSNHQLASVASPADPLHVGASLKHLASLRELNISWINLGPAGVKFITHLTHLESLDISGTRAGEAAVAAMEAALPRLKKLELCDFLDMSC